MLTRQVPGWGYYIKPSKSALIVRPENLKYGKVFGTRHGFKLRTGAHDIGGYIGDGESKSNWLIEFTLKWEKNISMISKNAGKYPQESYATVVRAIQSERIFLQHVIWDT